MTDKCNGPGDSPELVLLELEELEDEFLPAELPQFLVSEAPSFLPQFLLIPSLLPLASLLPVEILFCRLVLPLA